jgi:hypothetical protein
MGRSGNAVESTTNSRKSAGYRCTASRQAGPRAVVNHPSLTVVGAGACSQTRLEALAVSAVVHRLRPIARVPETGTPASSR